MSELSSTAQTAASGLRDDFRRGSKAYDLMAAIPLVVIYAVGALGQFKQLAGNLAKFDLAQPDFTLTIMLLSELARVLFAALIIGLLFARTPPRSSAKGLTPRIMAILGTYFMVGVLLMPRHELSATALTISATLILGGMAFAVYALLYLGRSISVMAEARRLVTGGPYRLVRHPLYLGEEIVVLGTLMQFFSPWALLVLALQIGCQLYRMHREEQVLAASFPEYATYKQSTWRILPGVY
jgi:protein-S-isoprenylcysteine O-methyltransferase Ste14